MEPVKRRHSSTTRPKISVLMMAYNHEAFIAQAVESVVMQDTEFDYEIVIGEDCSTDRTRQILLDFQRRHPDRIRLLLPDQNLGPHQNFVQTLQACQGEYTAMLEGDDYWTSPHKLQNQVAFLDTHPECAMCFHPVTKFYEDGSQQPTQFPPRGMMVRTLEDLFKRNLIQNCSVLFRRDLIAEIPPWMGSLKMGDWPLFILIAEHGDIGYLDEVMAAYRVHPGGSWSMKSEAAVLQEGIKMLKQVDEHFEFKYHPTINKIRFACQCEVAWAYAKVGAFPEAWGIARQCMATCPPNRYAYGQVVKMLLRLRAPRIYYFLQSFRPRCSLSRREPAP